MDRLYMFLIKIDPIIVLKYEFVHAWPMKQRVLQSNKDLCSEFFKIMENKDFKHEPRKSFIWSSVNMLEISIFTCFSKYFFRKKQSFRRNLKKNSGCMFEYFTKELDSWIAKIFKSKSVSLLSIIVCMLFFNFSEKGFAIFGQFFMMSLIPHI